MAKATPPRLSLDETWTLLEGRGEKMPRTSDGKPFVYARPPRYDDDELGFSFFRTGADDDDYSNLMLPRTYFARSELKGVSFCNTDLSQSVMCWNDFIQCDFSGADLSGCDMRSSTFVACKFRGAILTGADLRRGSFEECTFRGADLIECVANDEHYATEFGLFDALTRQQQYQVTWREDPGPEPDGG